MDIATWVILIILSAFFGFMLIVKITQCVLEFRHEHQYLKLEMNRSYDEKEFLYWRKELRCHSLCLIPFVSKRNVDTVYKHFFRK